jgi:hypothetical protein
LFAGSFPLELARSAQGRWDESDGVIAAENFVELDGEREVDDSLDDAQIITMVTTRDAQIALYSAIALYFQ